MSAQLVNAFGWGGGESTGINTLLNIMQATIVTTVGFLILVSNLLIIVAFLNFRGLSHNILNYYLLSLASADFLCGLIIIPLSVDPAITGDWMYGNTMCRLAGYVEVTLWCISVYTFMWISVDRYLAVKKPLRYDTVQSRTRSQCWVVFTWISAAMMVCPPLLGYQKEAKFDNKTLICMLDWSTTYAYTATVAALVLGPSVISIVYNYYYIFSMKIKLRNGVHSYDKEYATALAEKLSNPSHLMTFILVVLFWLSWTPYAAIRFYEFCAGHEIETPMVHFIAVWMGILNSAWKFPVLLSLSPDFRLGLKVLFQTFCCRFDEDQEVELNTVILD